MNPTPPSAAEAGCPSSRPRPRLGLRKFPAKGRQLAALLNLSLNLNKKAPAPSSQPHDGLNLNFNLKPRARASRGSAFTLIELMVAAAITTLLLLGMTGIFDQSMKAWRLSSRRADAERELRAALSQIERDLSAAVVSSNLPIYLNIVATNRVNIPNPFRTNLPNRVGNPGVDWANISAVIFFASLQPSQSGETGDLAGIGYFVAWDPDSNGGNGSWNLYRRYQSPASLLGGLSNRVTLTNLNQSSPGPYQSNSIPAPEILAANVLNFWISPVVFRNNGQPATLPTNSSGNIDLGALGSGTWITNRPAYFQLELTAYGGEQVRGFVAPTDPARRALWGNTSNIAKFGRSFIWRVDL